MTPQDALLASSPPRSGHKPKKRETPRACPLLDRPFLMLAREPCSARLRRVSSIPTARLTLKSAVCGLNGLLPTLRVGALHLKSSTAFRALAPSPLCAVLKRKLTFPFWKEKLRLAHFFSPKRNPKIPGEKGRKKATWLEPKRRQPFN
jgi:hypothetical protein